LVLLFANAYGAYATAYTLVGSKLMLVTTQIAFVITCAYSDEGQIEYAKGFVHPIRTSVKLPADVLAKFPPAEDYKVVSFVNDAEALGIAAEAIAKGWDEVAAIE